MTRMTTFFRSTMWFLFLTMMCLHTYAADIAKISGEKGGIDVITVKGKFIAGDEDKFKGIALTTKRAMVVLDSPGGRLAPALEIGRIVRLKGYSTLVRDVECSSGCALIWLAGEPRIMNNAAMIGFHAVSIKDEKGARNATASGNARVGAYLVTMGFSEKMVEFVTDASPEDMQWLKKSTADRLGLMVSFTTDDEQQKARQLFNAGVKKRTGVDASDAAAAHLYAQAAEAGFAGAQNNLGDLYETGMGVPKSDRMALYWYVRAAERGEPTAYLSLANILKQQSSDKDALVEALKFAILAYTTLVEGANKLSSQNLITSISAQLSDTERNRAFDMAKQWTPLYQEEFLMSDKANKNESRGTQTSASK